ncbi:hypothetical protein C8R46DRAFT_1350344 [Mycena filopes]|nr:hypothetical protein C8R46DRAFT_1350344 [Mycena filopes]
MCCDAHESFNTSITRHIQSWNCHSWLTQANYIFSSLHIESDLENYVLVDDIYFTVTVPNPTGACPDGYLFLCSKEHFRVGASFKWPDVPAYWSLDPSGVERLSMEEAARLGFPRLELITKIYGMSWDTSLYAGLRQFHQAKGFNPESQDVARHLGLPLFRLSTEEDPPFAHVGDYGEEDEDWGENELSSDWPDSETDDASVDERDGTSEAPEGSGEEEKSTSGAEGLNHCNLLPGNADTDSEVRSTSPVHGSAGTSGQFHYSEDLSSLPMLHSSDEDIPVSLTFKILMNVQLVLILFLATCWVYDNLQ